MKRMYPVIFTQTDNGVLVEVPDLEILTEGTDMENAIDMARDAISITIISMEDNNEAVTEPTRIEDVDVLRGTFAENGKGFVSIVDTNIDEYRRKVDTKPVRRNVSLPGWLNYEVNAAGINVSRFLQDALVEKLNIDRRM
ncbi:MAG: type II toxin-antitoxin system HicB family antitoxin [Clostridia bacterium]|nr:type II toxin-antitoxin system HicB family antitoxin [Clostridia bacterium]